MDPCLFLLADLASCSIFGLCGFLPDFCSLLPLWKNPAPPFTNGWGFHSPFFRWGPPSIAPSSFSPNSRRSLDMDGLVIFSIAQTALFFFFCLPICLSLLSQLASLPFVPIPPPKRTSFQDTWLFSFLQLFRHLLLPCVAFARFWEVIFFLS